jgi:hypothetical protein
MLWYGFAFAIRPRSSDATGSRVIDWSRRVPPQLKSSVPRMTVRRFRIGPMHLLIAAACAFSVLLVSSAAHQGFQAVSIHVSGLTPVCAIMELTAREGPLNTLGRTCAQ